MQHELYLKEFSVAFLSSTSLGREQCVCIYSVMTKKSQTKNPQTNNFMGKCAC